MHLQTIFTPLTNLTMKFIKNFYLNKGDVPTYVCMQTSKLTYVENNNKLTLRITYNILKNNANFQ